VRIEKPGFRTYVHSGIVLTASERLPLGTIQLAVGDVRQQITVISQGQTVNTESGEPSSFLSARQMDSSIARGRDPINLLKILPGVSQITSNGSGSEVSESDPGIGDSSPGGEFGTFSPNIGGMRSYWNNTMLDGQPADTTGIRSLYSSVLSMDSIAEVRLNQNTYSAEFGPNPGPTVSIVTKSGTSQFHGNVYWENRNREFVANDFFNNRNGVPKPAYRFNNVGGTIGGPVYIPKLLTSTRDKLFFFFSTDYWDITQPGPLNRLTVPTGLERNGDFSQTLDQSGSLIPIIDPQSKAPFLGNVIPTSRLDPNMQALLNVFPAANVLDRSVSLGAYNYQWQESPHQQKISQLLRLDYNISPKDTLIVRGSRWNSDILEYNGGNVAFNQLPLVRVGYRFTMDNAQARYIRTFTPNLVNELSFGIRGEKELPSHLEGGSIFEPVTRSGIGFTLGQLYPSANPNDFIPEAVFGGIPNRADLTYDYRLPIDASMSYLTLSNIASYAHASHTFKFGLYVQRTGNGYGSRSGSSPSGHFDFTRNPNNPGDANWPYATALLGNFNSYTESNQRIDGTGRIWNVDWFAQDTWKVTSRLTLGYGLRFSWFTPWLYNNPSQAASFSFERYNAADLPPLYRPAFDPSGNRVAQDPVTGAFAPAPLIGAFVPGTGDPFSGMVVDSDKNYPDGFTTHQAVEIGTRFSFAYDVFGNGTTAIRGGFGTLKETQPTVNPYQWSSFTNPPVEISPKIFYGDTSSLLNSKGVLFPSGVSSIEKHMNTPTVYQYSIGVQRRIGKSTLLDVSYVGNLGRHLLQTRDYDTLPYGARFQPQNADPTNPGSALPDALFTPYLGYTSISYLQASGISNYNSFQVSATHRFTSGIEFGASYTWSKTMDLTDGEGGLLARYISDRVWSYGLAGFDQSQMLVFNYVWPLPKTSRGPGFVRAIINDWQLSGVTTFATGLPQGVNVNTTDGADITGGGDGVRAVLLQPVELSHSDRSFSEWFNAGAFGRPATGTFGNASKAVFRGPGINNWDISVMRNFPFGSESRYIQLRGEFYNAFNHTQFATIDNDALFDPDGKQVNGQFGQVISTRPPRIIQLALKVYF
jgi:hypothetical protein